MLLNSKKPKKISNHHLIGISSESPSEIFRKRLLLKQTKAEKIVNNILSILNIKYEKQHVIYYNPTKFFILDVYIPDKRICIEIDGNHHLEEEQMKKDKLRTTILNKLDIKVFRFINKEVYQPNFIWEIINLYQSV